MKAERLSPIPTNPLAVIYSLVQQTIGLVNSRTHKIQNSEGRHFFSLRKDLSKNSHAMSVSQAPLNQNFTRNYSPKIINSVF